jgi:hypothetical protein
MSKNSCTTHSCAAMSHKTFHFNSSQWDVGIELRQARVTPGTLLPTYVIKGCSGYSGKTEELSSA